MDIMVRICTNTSVDRELARWMVWFARESEWDIDIHYTYSHGVQEHRNLVVREFLRTECTHLWFIDADTIPPRSLRWLDFLSDSVQILGCPYPGYVNTTVYWHVYRKKDRHYASIVRKNWPNEPIFEVDALGTGCIVISREVFLKINRPDPFCLVRHQDGRIGTEDYFFSNEAQNAGFKLWACPKYTCGHIKDVNLKEVAR